MLRAIGIISIATVLISGCSLLDDEEYACGQWASVELVEVGPVTAGKVDFTCHATVGDPCHDFERADIEKTITDIHIRLYSMSRGGQACPQILDTLVVPISVSVEGGASYTFRFWRIGRASLDTTVYVP